MTPITLYSSSVLLAIVGTWFVRRLPASSIASLILTAVPVTGLVLSLQFKGDGC